MNIDTTMQTKAIRFPAQAAGLLGALSLPGNPYDGHTLKPQLEQVRRLVPGQVKEAYVDMGCRGHGHEGGETIHVDRRRRGNLARTRRKRMKHRAAVEPTIGHCKSEHRMERNWLRGELGDAINALLSAASMNFQKRLAAFWHFILRLVLGLKLQPALPCLSLNV